MHTHYAVNAGACNKLIIPRRTPVSTNNCDKMAEK